MEPQPGQPPTPGFSPDALSIRLTAGVIDAAEAMRFVEDPAAGGTVLFSGTVRDHSAAGAVSGLEYEAWEDRGRALMEDLGRELFERWPLRRVVLWHRFGALGIGEVSVIVCVSAGHRAEAFEAARYGIERIKADVPIWKKEHLPDGETKWVMGS